MITSEESIRWSAVESVWTQILDEIRNAVGEAAGGHERLSSRSSVGSVRDE
jgi:hypothetical protein